MKKISLILFFPLLIVLFASCERPDYDDEIWNTYREADRQRTSGVIIDGNMWSARSLNGLEWEDAALGIHRDGLRLVEEDANGYGYDLTPAEVDTLAGCINSVHDLMGMIIVDNSDALIDNSNLQDVDSGAIYYYPNSGSFKRKHEGFEYTEVDYSYLTFNPPLVEEDYIPGYYYLDN